MKNDVIAFHSVCYKFDFLPARRLRTAAVIFLTEKYYNVTIIKRPSNSWLRKFNFIFVVVNLNSLK